MNEESIFSTHLQNSYVKLAITDSAFLKQTRAAVKPAYFDSDTAITILEVCFNYFDTFGEAPKENFTAELKNKLKKKTEPEKDLFRKYLGAIKKQIVPNTAYVTTKLNAFIQAREFESAAIELIELADVGKLEEGKAIMVEALKAGVDSENLGIDYLDGEEPHYYKLRHQSEALCGFGIPLIDSKLKIRRGKSYMIAGQYKGGKSWICQKIGVNALYQGKTVVHVSLENSAEETEQRYDMIIGGLTTHNDTQKIDLVEYDEFGCLVRNVQQGRNSVYNRTCVAKARQKIKNAGGKLYIKKYPMGAATVLDIDAYLSQLEAQLSVIPDVLIIDYPDILSTDNYRNMDNREKIGKVYIQCKRWADELHCAVIIPSQLNADEAYAESKAKAGHVDVAIKLTATDTEKENNISKFWVEHNRSGADAFGCMLYNVYEAGLIAYKSWAISSNSGGGDIDLL